MSELNMNSGRNEAGLSYIGNIEVKEVISALGSMAVSVNPNYKACARSLTSVNYSNRAKVKVANGIKAIEEGQSL